MRNKVRKTYNLVSSKASKGFTLIELLIVIAIIGILATIGIASFTSIQANARNTQRSSRVTILSEALEKYYDANGEYPTCAALTASPGTVTTTTLKGVDPNVLASPTAASGTNSISCTTPTADTFGYIGGGNSYTLMYQGEGDASPTSVNSRRQVTSAMYNLTLIAGAGGAVSGGGSYASGATPTITASPNTYYSFSSWTGSTGCSGVASHNVTITADMTCTANFTATSITMPAAPTVSANTTGATTTYSWGAASCPGNSARYQYRYTISPSGFDSGLVSTASTSVAFTTSTEGQTYTVATQAECYNAATGSGMSVAGSSSYYRPITQYTLTIAAGTGGVVNAGGTYNIGTTQTITATPNTYYSFSSWTGDAACSGGSSSTVVMNSNISCTANFVPTAIAAPATPVVASSTAGTTTTFSWGAASCPGNSVRYQYRYTISPSGYDSGLVATTSTSVAFTTSTEGQTYMVATQAECYNGVTASGMSAIGSGQFYRTSVFIAITAGVSMTCGIKTADSKAYCWGDNGYMAGRLGNGTTNSSIIPGSVYTAGVLNGKTIKSIESRSGHTCVIASDNQVYCWGDGTVGGSSNTPIAINTSGVLLGKTISSISNGNDHTCAIASDSQAYCWGSNSYGQLGNNSNTDSTLPVAVNNGGVLSGKTLKSISSGFGHTCVIASDNQAYCWGRNIYGALGNNSYSASTVPVAVYTGGVLSGKTIKSISSGGHHTCAVASDNQAYCWGYNADGELGNNAPDYQIPYPVAVSTGGVFSGKTITTIYGSAYNTCAIASDNQAYCWGQGSYGVLGNNSSSNTYVPVAVYSGSPLNSKTIKSLAMGTQHVCAIASDDLMYCWGYNYTGQFGNNQTNTMSRVPTEI